MNITIDNFMKHLNDQKFHFDNMSIVITDAFAELYLNEGDGVVEAVFIMIIDQKNITVRLPATPGRDIEANELITPTEQSDLMTRLLTEILNQHNHERNYKRVSDLLKAAAKIV